MMLVMKQISLAFDVDHGLVPNLPNVLQYSGYTFCAGSVIFGPFTTYQEYNQVMEGKKIVGCLTLLLVFSASFY